MNILPKVSRDSLATESAHGRAIATINPVSVPADVVTRLDDLKVPPGNRLHGLVGDLAGYHAIRVNDQYRVVFRFEGHDANDIQCTDYH